MYVHGDVYAMKPNGARGLSVTPFRVVGNFTRNPQQQTNHIEP